MGLKSLLGWLKRSLGFIDTERTPFGQPNENESSGDEKPLKGVLEVGRRRNVALGDFLCNFVSS